MGLVLFSEVAVAEAAPPAPGYTESLFKGLMSDAPVERQLSWEAIVLEGNKIKRGLLNIASLESESYESFSPRELAIRALGRLQVVEAIPIFVRDIDFTYEALEWDESDFRLARFPCAGALRDIGAPSRDGILDYLKKNAPQYVSELKIELFAEVATELNGGHVPSAVGWLESEASIERGNMKRLHSALRNLAKQRGYESADE